MIKVDPEPAWCFQWLKTFGGGPGFFCVHTTQSTREPVWENMIKSLKKPGENKETTRKRIRRKGGRVVKVWVTERI